VNVLDENITRDQAELLARWGIRARSIGRDLGAQGLADEEIVPLLLKLKKPTLLTRDSDFFDVTLAHRAYALVFFETHPSETAYFIRRFLRHTAFRESAQRLGKVIRVHQHGIESCAKSRPPVHVPWTPIIR
jgi:hypothetical protein